MLCLLAAIAVAPAQSRPNIVVIFSDDHARRAISAYGSDLIRTPAIDRLSREGVRFERHTTSNPLCAPSRATLLTGKHSHINGHKDNRTTFDPNQPTFPKRLREAGYETATIGKWHLVSDPQGFDHWEVLPGQGVYFHPDFLTPSGRKNERGYVTEVITDKTVEWLRKEHSKPFFLLVGHKAPHRNWVPDFKHIDLFANREFPEPPTMRTDYATLVSAAKSVLMRIDEHMRPGSDLMYQYVPPRLDESETEKWQQAWVAQDEAHRLRLEKRRDLLGANYQRYIRNYLRCVAAIDESVGRILEELERNGQLENTIVVYTSDQGFFLGENAWYDKRWFYEPSAGTPLLIRMPNRTAAGRVVDTPTGNVDLAPTILEWAGISATSDLQGGSLNGLIRGERTARPPVYGHFYESDDVDHKAPKYVAVATARHKLIYYYDLDEWELFDLAHDPHETRNLWPAGVALKVRHEMVRKLLARQRVLDEEPAIQLRTSRAALASLPTSRP